MSPKHSHYSSLVTDLTIVYDHRGTMDNTMLRSITKKAKKLKDKTRSKRDKYECHVIVNRGELEQRTDRNTFGSVIYKEARAKKNRQTEKVDYGLRASMNVNT